MLVLGGGTVGVLSGSFSLHSIAKLIHTSRMSCSVKTATASPPAASPAASPPAASPPAASPATEVKPKVTESVNLNKVNAKAREQIARGGKRKTRKNRKH